MYTMNSLKLVFCTASAEKKNFYNKLNKGESDIERSCTTTIIGSISLRKKFATGGGVGGHLITWQNTSMN